jgi:sugar phosphate isomerase/epimerase
MKERLIALQVYSVRDAAEADFAGTMRQVKEMGYDGVELAGTYGMTAVEAKKILDEIGLELN